MAKFSEDQELMLNLLSINRKAISQGTSLCGILVQAARTQQGVDVTPDPLPNDEDVEEVKVGQIDPATIAP